MKKIEKLAMQALPVVLGVMASGALMYFGRELPFMKAVRQGFDKGL